MMRRNPQPLDVSQPSSERASRVIEMRRAWDNLLPFLIGLVVGLLSTYSSFAGRMATLESRTQQDKERIDKLELLIENQISPSLARLNETLASIRAMADKK